MIAGRKSDHGNGSRTDRPRLAVARAGEGGASESACTGPAVDDTVETLILDLLEWIGPTTRPYAEVLEAWKTSCPRLPVWEEATDRGFIVRHRSPGQDALVSVSAIGAEHLRGRRQARGADAWPR